MTSDPHFFRHKVRLAIGVGAILLSLASHATLDQAVSSTQSFGIDDYRQLAESGDVEAMYNLGVIYSRGMGVEQSFVESLKWHRLAAEKGLVIAMRSVAIRYEKGEGTQKSYIVASEWYKRAALLGDFASMNNLASMYSKGQGVEQDLAMAYAWVTLAVEVSSSDPDARAYLDTYILNKKRANALLNEAGRMHASQLVEKLRQHIRY